MSKDIWHRYDEAPKHQDIIMTDTGCWAYRTDLLALETELDRTRKALDVAVDAIDVISLKYHKDTPPIFLIKYAQNAKDQITALEQKDVK